MGRRSQRASHRLVCVIDSVDLEQQETVSSCSSDYELCYPDEGGEPTLVGLQDEESIEESKRLDWALARFLGLPDAITQTIIHPF